LISGNANRGVFIYGPDAHGNTIAGNYIGTDITGTEVISNTRGGVLINNGAYENVIGGDTRGEMNLISGNGGTGVFIELESHNNSIIGNTIGTDITGMEALGNKFFGVAVSSSANTKIGGTSPGEGNLISGNGYSGINIENEESIDNLIAGNQIGTDKTGTKALPNTYGVFIGDGASGTTIGGTTASAGNLISGNSLAGISISGEGTSGNIVVGNLLGTDSTGLSILKNREGVYISSGAQNNTIGGEAKAERNVISGNRNSGVTISGDNTTGNVILNNYIGVGVDGIKPLGNTSNGLYVSGSDNVIGPENIIAYNWLVGIYVHDEAAHNNVITQNSIYSNGHGEYPGIELAPGAHGDIQPPEITAATASGEVSGTACANCTVELFWSQTGDGQGEVYLGTTTATGAGAFSLSVTYPDAYNLTATATDTRGTSEFSTVFNPLYLSYLPITMLGD
jgi:titin